MKKNNLLILAGILVTVAVIGSGCTGEVAPAKEGDTVSVHYTGKFDDGTVFDSSVDGEPLQFTVGAGQVIPGFERAVIGMKPGESVTVTIPATEAYGPYREELVIVVDRSELPADMEPQVGEQIVGGLAGGGQRTGVIIEVTDSSVTIDANHPLAGKDLTFDIELVDIS